MEIVLLENINKLGKIGEKVKVKNGFARNFLLKKGKALRATKENLDFVNKKKDELNKKNTQIRQKYIEVSKKINNKIISFSKETKENGELYASIKPKEISVALQDQLKTDIKPSQIILKSEVNKVGEFKFDVNLHSDVSSIVKIKVKKLSSNN